MALKKFIKATREFFSAHETVEPIEKNNAGGNPDQPSARPSKLGKPAQEEIWVSSDGAAHRIADMDESHVKNALAMIVHKVRTDHAAVMSRNGKVTFYPILHTLKDEYGSFIDEDQNIRHYKPRPGRFNP